MARLSCSDENSLPSIMSAGSKLAEKTLDDLVSTYVELQIINTDKDKRQF
jgi:hypothetical protein